MNHVTKTYFGHLLLAQNDVTRVKTKNLNFKGITGSFAILKHTTDNP